MPADKSEGGTFSVAIPLPRWPLACDKFVCIQISLKTASPVYKHVYVCMHAYNVSPRFYCWIKVPFDLCCRLVDKAKTSCALKGWPAHRHSSGRNGHARTYHCVVHAHFMHNYYQLWDANRVQVLSNTRYCASSTGKNKIENEYSEVFHQLCRGSFSLSVLYLLYSYNFTGLARGNSPLEIWEYVKKIIFH